MKRSLFILSLCCFCLTVFAQEPYWLNRKGMTVESRIKVPEGYRRDTLPADSFGTFLRRFPLEVDGTKVVHYNGAEKRNPVYVAVLKADVGKRDLQQCADAVIRLRAEYLYSRKEYERIHFNFTNGFRADYSRWAKGERIRVTGNRVEWYKAKGEDYSYPTFRAYLDCVFAYAGTLSLNRELHPVAFADLQVGDVLIQGGSPGHAVIVMDVATNRSGKKIYLLAQSYMPAQSIHILKNPTNPTLSPWYEMPTTRVIETPEWNFMTGNLKRW